MHSDISLQVAPVIMPHKEGTATIIVWNRYTHMQPTGPTIGYVSPWWQTSVCESYFLEYWKKTLDEQIDGLFSETAASSNTYNQE